MALPRKYKRFCLVSISTEIAASREMFTMLLHCTDRFHHLQWLEWTAGIFEDKFPEERLERVQKDYKRQMNVLLELTSLCKKKSAVELARRREHFVRVGQ